MKPLNELVEELRKKEAFSHINISAKRAAGIGYAAAKLQAWLREADDYLRVEAKLCEGAADIRSGDVKQHYGGRIFSCHRFREVLLGTTRTEGKK